MCGKNMLRGLAENLCVQLKKKALCVLKKGETDMVSWHSIPAQTGCFLE